MKKLIPSYVRVPVLFAIVFAAMEYFIDSGEKPAFIEYPMVSLFLGVFLFLLIAIEIVVSAVDKVTYHLLSDEQKKQLEEAQSFSFADSKLMKMLTRSKDIEEEEDVMLEHDYDGIKELDNVLPPWWVYLFYGCVIFAVVYLVRFHVIGDYTQKEEYEKEVALAEEAYQKYLLTAPDMVNVDNVELLTDAASIAEGKKIYEANNCFSCHGQSLEGGIGPNLVDAHWINGGGVKNIFKLVSEGSTTNPVMAPWKDVIKPSDIQKLSSYIVSLGGTNPANAKEAEGEVWTDDSEPIEVVTTDVDSTVVE
jgi:cytochrome c oxidase cbb3-type subunit 3